MPSTMALFPSAKLLTWFPGSGGSIRIRKARMPSQKKQTIQKTMEDPLFDWMIAKRPEATRAAGRSTKTGRERLRCAAATAPRRYARRIQ